MPFIYVDVHLKTILAVTLFSIILWRVCQRFVYQKMEFAARLSSCEVERSEVHEIFIRIDMKHSYFSNYFVICFPSFFSIIKL